DKQLQADSRKSQTQTWQRAKGVQRVTAFEHVGHRPALEVSVGQARDLVEKAGAQPSLKVAAHAALYGGEYELHAKEGSGKRNQCAAGPQSLLRSVKKCAHVERATEEDCFEDDTNDRHTDRQDGNGRRQHSILNECVPQGAE